MAPAASSSIPQPENGNVCSILDIDNIPSATQDDVPFGGLVGYEAVRMDVDESFDFCEWSQHRSGNRQRSGFAFSHQRRARANAYIERVSP